MSDLYQEIGEASGKIYRGLEKGEQTLTQLQKSSGVDDKALFNQAIGWLAREGKLNINNSGKAPKVSLKTCCA